MAPGGTTGGTTTPVTSQPPPLSPGTTTGPLFGAGGGFTPGAGPVIPDPPKANGSNNLLQNYTFLYAVNLLPIFLLLIILQRV